MRLDEFGLNVVSGVRSLMNAKAMLDAAGREDIGSKVDTTLKALLPGLIVSLFVYVPLTMRFAGIYRQVMAELPDRQDILDEIESGCDSMPFVGVVRSIRSIEGYRGPASRESGDGMV